MLEHTIK